MLPLRGPVVEIGNTNVETAITKSRAYFFGGYSLSALLLSGNHGIDNMQGKDAIHVATDSPEGIPHQIIHTTTIVTTSAYNTRL